MNPLLRSFVSLIFVFMTASAGAAVDLQLPLPTLETLPNGLQIAWFVDNKLPVVDLSLMARSGYRDEPAGKTGVAELLGATLNRGSKGMDAQAVARAIENLGGSASISADDDTFTVSIHGLAPDAPALLDVFSKIILQPEFPEAEIRREHARILDRWKHVSDYGDSLASLAFFRLLAAGTEYARGSFLSAKEFASVKRSDVLKFYQQHFTPKNALLVVVGRVDREGFRKLISDSFGKWSGEAPKRKRMKYSDPRLPKKKGEIVLVERAKLTQANVRIGFLAPLLTSPDTYPLAVGNALLGEYFNSRLNSVIRDKLGLTYSIGSGISYSKDFARFAISSATRNESVGQLISQTLSILKDMKKGTIDPTEVATAKEYLLGSYPLRFTTLSAAASRWASGELMELGPEYYNGFLSRVASVTHDQVIKAMAKNMDIDSAVIVVAGDPKEVMAGLKSTKLKIRQVKPRDLL